MPFEPLRQLRSRPWLIERSNIDTDIVFPARFLLRIERSGMGRYAFHDWRTTPEGLENPEFPSAMLTDNSRQILVAGANFGCGSSREQAVWSLADLGLRCVIAPSFGDIFYNNCFKNGVLPISLSNPEKWSTVLNAARAEECLEIDLESLTISTGDGNSEPRDFGFEVPDFQRDSLLNGWDEIDRMLTQDSDDIRAFENTRRQAMPWLFQSLE
ncbi:MAG: 3-isopropylmalate dehydratase small subunit [Congregibacter sp.]